MRLSRPRAPPGARLETELIDEDSPFKGTRAFGMCLAVGNGIASIGTMLHIQQHSRRPEGRMEVLSRGGRRFRIVRVVKELPVLLCEVEWLEDTADVMGEDDVFTLPELADELRVLYQTTLSLSNKVNRGESGIDELPAPELSPEELSFWLMRVFQQYPTKQQVRKRARAACARACAVLTSNACTRPPAGAAGADVHARAPDVLPGRAARDAVLPVRHLRAQIRAR